MDGFFNCFYWPWCSTHICWEDSVLLWVWVERRSMGKLNEFLKERQQQELYHCENIIFFFPTSNFLRNHGTEIFLLFLIMCIWRVSIFFFKSFSFGTVLHKKWLPLRMYFPFPVSGKIFLYSILIFRTFWSIVPIKCCAVAPYRISNIYSLFPVTVMVLLCVNDAATVCDSLCLLCCSTDWAVDVICDDARKPFWHVRPFARFSYMIDNQLFQDRQGFFFLCTVINPQGNGQNYSSLYLNLHIFL